MSDWISVEDKLPDDDTDVLVYGGGRYNVAAHTSDNGNGWICRQWVIMAIVGLPMNKCPNGK